MNKVFLKLVMLPSGLWRGMGADTEQLEAILAIRLKMDDRKPLSFGRQAKKKAISNASFKTMFVSCLMGVIYTMFSYVHDIIFSLTIYFGYVLIWLSIMLITDFSNVLFDVRDKFILVPRPVNDKTIVLSKLLHVFIYLFRIVIPLVMPEIIFLGIYHGWKSVVLFPIAVLCLLFMTLFAINFCYLLLIKYAARKFKEIINYFQIGVSVIFFAAIYLRPRSIDAEGNMVASIHQFKWIRFFPPYWIAVSWNFLGYKTELEGTQWLSILAIIVPLACLLLMIKWLAPQFGRNLNNLDISETSEIKQGAVVTPASTKKRLYQKLANIFNRNDTAKAGFNITWLQTSRSRSFKMRVYPSFAYVIVYFVFLITKNSRSSFSEAWHDLPNQPNFIILLYMCVFVILNAMNYLYISDQYKAAWVYFSSPVDVPGKVLSGAFKALWTKYLLPFFLLLSAFTLVVWGWHTILDIILALVNVTLFAVCMISVGARHFPFSTAEQINQSGYRVIRAFLSMFLIFLLGAGHYFLVKLDVLGLNIILKIIFLLLSSAFLWLVWNSYSNTSWTVIKKAEEQ
jgi:ABC-2 type transport system permease protein